MMLASAFLFLLTQGDNALVGKILGIENLGFHALAYTLANLPATNFSHIIARVTFPAYAQIQRNKELLRRSYLKVLRYVILVAFPSSIGLILLSKEIVITIYGAKWAPIIWPMAILSLFGMFRAITSTAGTLFVAVGNPKTLKNITLIQLLIMAVTIYPLTLYYGIIGTAISVTLAHLISISIAFHLTAKIIEAPFKVFLDIAKVPFLASIIMIICVLSFKILVFWKLLLTNTLLLVAIGGVSYVIALHIFEKDLLRNVLMELRWG